jgi:hypothetical protein
MQELMGNKTALVFTLWHRAIFEALRAGLIVGGVFYGGVVFPFFMTIHQGFNNFLGETILGLGLGIPISILTAFFISLVCGLVVAILTIFYFYPLRDKQTYRIIIGVIAIVCSVIGVLLALAFFQSAPYYTYNIVSWNGSEITLIVLAIISSWWATHRFAKWYTP